MPDMDRWIDRLWIGLGLMLSMLPAEAVSAPFRPNIILITVDTFRPDHIGYYGYFRDTSPHLDTISREGVFFKQAFSSSGWTTPGLISILTSLYTPTHGVDIRGRRLDPDVETLPDVLKGAGYRAPDIFFLTDLPNFSNLGLGSYARRNQYIYQGDEIIFKWLEEESGGERPFFLYYHYRDLHLPYNPGEEYEAMFMPEAFDSALGLVSAVKKFIAKDKMEVVKKNVMLVRGAMDFGPSDKGWVDALYDGEIRRLDEEFFSRLRQTLKQEGLDRNTLLIISADHGEELLDHGLIGHVSTYKEGRLYDEVIRIPLIFWLPSVMPAGRVIDEPVQCLDVMPTILDLLDIPLPEGVQGQSLLPLIRKEPEWESKPLYFETSGGGYTADSVQYLQRVRAIRNARWKLIHDSAEDEYRLYDLASDPGESENVQGKYQHIADSLRTLLNQWVLYTQKRAYKQTEDELYSQRGVAEETGTPRILFPQDGDTLNYQGADYSIRPRWTGLADASYVLEYNVGKGAYHLEGVLTEPGTSPNYGPFQANFWNSLVLYNPWKFRVYRKDQPDKKSDWVTFYLAPTGSGTAMVSVPGLFLQLQYSLLIAVEQGGYLVWGLGRGLLDLCLWVASVPVMDLSAYVLLLVIVGAVAWPQVQRLGPRRCGAWAQAILYIGFVYATIPLMPEVWKILNEYTQGAIRYAGVLVVVLVCIAILVRIWQRVRASHWKPYVALGLIFLVYVYVLNKYTTFPAERLHLVEYGFVGYFFFKALRLDLSERSAYLVSFVLTVIVGFGDESIQWILPQRFFELKDVQLNALSGGLGLLLLRFVLGSEGSERRS